MHVAVLSSGGMMVLSPERTAKETLALPLPFPRFGNPQSVVNSVKQTEPRGSPGGA